MLKDIYIYRCLTVRQSYNRYHAKRGMQFNDFIEQIIKPLMNAELIEVVKYNDNK